MQFLSERIYQDHGGAYRLRNGDRPVTSILNCLDSHMSYMEVKEKYEGLTSRDIDACRVMAMMVMEDRHEYRKNKGEKKTRTGGVHPPVKFMFDENLSWRLIPHAANRVSEVSQIHLEDMAGAKDIEIWNKFKTNGSRAVIVTKDDDSITLAKVFSMHAMMSERSYSGLDKHLKRDPYVVHISTKRRNGGAPLLGVSDVSNAFNANVIELVKQAMKEPQAYVYTTLTKDRIFKGPELPEIFQSYITDVQDTLYEFDIDKTHPETIDLLSLDFERAINWDKLNRDRVHVELPPISADDYALPAYTRRARSDPHSFQIL